MSDRETITGLASQYIGCRTGDEREAFLVNVYNLHSPPLPRGVRATTAMAWCAISISAWAQMIQRTDIIPYEMGVWEMVQIAKQMGIMQLRDYTPKPGDIIVYDWLKDDGTGVKKQDGRPDHVGLVEEVGENYVTSIEGNCNGGQCCRRTIDRRDIQIYGYIAPNYESDAVQPDQYPGGAEAYDPALDGTYTVKTGLYLRTGAGMSNRAIVTMPKGAEVTCEGYYTMNGSTPWYYVTYKNYMGFCSSKYLIRKE